MNNCDIFIIGSGPAGYVAAIRAAQLGMKVVVVDERERPGGTCLNIGCIPSKALLHSSQKFYELKNDFDKHGISADNVRLDLKKFLGRKESIVDELTRGIGFLFKKNNITFVAGKAQLLGAKSVQVKTTTNELKHFTPTHIIIATGSYPSELPGIEIDEKQILSSTGILSLSKVPKHLVVVGGGYIGLEMASVWSRLGAAVTVIEYASHILPNMDKELGLFLKQQLEKQGFIFKLSTRVTAIHKKDNNLSLHISPSQETDSSKLVPDVLECDTVLISIGRKPFTKGLGLEDCGVHLDPRGFIQVDQNYQTNIPGIYAIGDVIEGMMLAHKASDEGITLVEKLSGQKPYVNYDIIPAVIYTHPEVASVGKTEEELKKLEINYKVGKFPFSANSRSKTVGDTVGFVKILADAKTDKVLGVHIIGEMAGTMIAQAAQAMEFSTSSEDIARSCHAHPTHSEALKEAAWATFASALHI